MPEGLLAFLSGAPIHVAQKPSKQRPVIHGGGFRQAGDGLRKVTLARVRDPLPPERIDEVRV